MKVAISATSNNLQAKLDNHFGRCSFFAILDTETGHIEFIANTYKDNVSGVGKKVSQFLNNLKVKKVIGFQFGVKIKEQFDQSGIQLIAIQDTEKSIGDFVNLLMNNKN